MLFYIIINIDQLNNKIANQMDHISLLFFHFIMINLFYNNINSNFKKENSIF